jgi:hypothetical protein
VVRVPRPVHQAACARGRVCAVDATSLPNDDRARIAGCTPASRWALVGMRCLNRRGSEEVGRGTRTSPCAPRRPVREGVCAVDIGHDAALRGVRSSCSAGAMVLAHERASPSICARQTMGHLSRMEEAAVPVLCVRRVRGAVGESGRAVVGRKSRGRVSGQAHDHDAALHAHPVPGRQRQRRRSD